MAFQGNGDSRANRLRFRFDRPMLDPLLGRGYSGRRTVVFGVLALLTLWGALEGGFLLWRADYRRRIQFGLEQVPPAIEPLREKSPPRVSAQHWSQAMDETRAMLEALVRSGTLGRRQIEELRSELAARASEADRNRSAGALVRIWCDMEARARPILVGIRYPAPLVPALALCPLEGKKPANVERATWRAALDETYQLLVQLQASGQVSSGDLQTLGAAFSREAAEARPDTAHAVLSRIWTRAAGQVREDVPERPEILKGPAR
jgi:hypothetical protein